MRFPRASRCPLSAPRTSPRSRRLPLALWRARCPAPTPRAPSRAPRACSWRRCARQPAGRGGARAVWALKAPPTRPLRRAVLWGPGGGPEGGPAPWRGPCRNPPRPANARALTHRARTGSKRASSAAPAPLQETSPRAARLRVGHKYQVTDPNGASQSVPRCAESPVEGQTTFPLSL